MKSIKFTEQELYITKMALLMFKSEHRKVLNLEINERYKRAIIDDMNSIENILDKVRDIEPDIENKSTNN